MGPGFFGSFRLKNDHGSKSVNSFESGLIFVPSLRQDLSRNVFAVSGYALWKKILWRAFFKHLEFDRTVENNTLSISFDIHEQTQFIRVDPCHEAVMLADELELFAYTADEKVSLSPVSMNHVDVVDGDVTGAHSQGRWCAIYPNTHSVIKARIHIFQIFL